MNDGFILSRQKRRKKKKKERAVEDAIEKIYGFGLSIFAKQDTRQVGITKILLLSKIKIV